MLRRIAVLIVLPLCVGCRAEVGERLPDDPDELVVYSIDGAPDDWPKGEPVPPHTGEVLYGYPVLGKVSIADADERRAVVTAIRDAVRDKSAVQSKCLYPRHAVRAVKGGETIELVICFQCGNYEGYRNGQPATKLTPSIAKSANPLLNQLLQAAGVPLAPVKDRR